MVSWSLPDMCTSDLSFWTMVSWSTWFFMYDMCTSDLSFWTMVSWSLPGPSCMTCVHQIFPSELWFLGLYLVLHVWHVYIRSFLLNYGFLVSTWFLHVWHVYIRSFLLNYGFLSLPGPSCMTCVHQIFPSELWFLGLYLVLHVWHVYIRSFLLNYGFLVSTWSFMYDMCTSDLSFWTVVSWSLLGPSCMKCVHQIFPSELWFLGLFLVLHVWHVYIRSFLLNYGFLVYLVPHVWHVYIRSFLLNYGFFGLPCPSCMTCVHQIFPSKLWFLCLPGPLCMTCVHQIFPSELWFLGLYLILHVWHVYIRS